MTFEKEFRLSCPVAASSELIQLAHGGGGRLMHRLIQEVFVEAFGNELLAQDHDATVFEVSAGEGRLAMTTDSYVVRPLFFPGGDIGSLAINGTVNDLSMAGAKPRYLSAGFIIEEGFPLESLRKVVRSMREAAERAGVRIITGDTKVVDKGKGDGLFVNTTGIGVVAPGTDVSPRNVTAGDGIIVSGDVGRHGVAIVAAREGLELETTVQSDCAPLWSMVEALLATVDVHCLRDLTRGGLATALNEIATSANARFLVEERAIPVEGQVQSVCELLGYDPLYVANEGRLVAFVPEAQAERALACLRAFPDGRRAALVGRVTSTEPGDRGFGRVRLKSLIGTERLLDLLAGEQLPRIC